MELDPSLNSERLEDQDLFLKLETIECETIYVQISFEEHAVNSKEAFKLGSMQVYQDLHGKLLAYSADLISENCLPEALE